MTDAEQEEDNDCFFNDEIYKSFKSKNIKTDRELLTNDGSIGYGGVEYSSTASYTVHTAPKEKQYKWTVLWPNLDPVIRGNFKLDDISFFSVTDMKSADKMTNIIMQLDDVDSCSVVCDATACIGGNSFSFIKTFENKNLVFIELDENRFDLLKHNLEVFASSFKTETSDTLKSLINLSVDADSGGKKTNGYKCLQGSCLDIIPQLVDEKQVAEFDVIFLDPPWGGELYRAREKVNLYLGSKTIGQVCKDLSIYTKYFAIKIPNNDKVDIDRLVKETNGCCSLIDCYCISKRIDLLLLKSRRKLSEKEVSYLMSFVKSK
eukprot:snap_masked-scaffold_15-processed-gene-4.48-mRNA-1 protein AED:1.00 eAED:1.00 QI:0/-1/0/0/-1/1/1/0/318